MCRKLVLVLGDQLDQLSSAFDDIDKDQDIIWMAEVAEESTHVWTHKARIALFLSAMRHFREQLLQNGFTVDYQEISEKKKAREPMSLAAALQASLSRFRKKGVRPDCLICVEPGEWRVRVALEEAAKSAGIPLEFRPDRHFFTTVDDFSEHAAGRKQLRLEFFYRPLRERFNILMDEDEPAGGQWNYDADNRGSFGKSGPEKLRPPKRFKQTINTCCY